MFILLAHNVTGTKEDGTSDYDVEARINEIPIARFRLEGHIRDEGAPMLLRRIADEWEKQPRHARIIRTKPWSEITHKKSEENK